MGTRARMAMRISSDRVFASILAMRFRAVDLDGARADAKRGGDDLVGLSRHQAFEDLALALRKTVKPRGDYSEVAVRDTLGPFERPL